MHDRNSVSFNAFGDAVMSTAGYFIPSQVTFRQIKSPDPDHWRLFAVEPLAGPQGNATSPEKVLSVDEARRSFNDRVPGKCFLALSPTESGPHRLIIRDGEKTRYVLPIHDR